MQDKNGNVTNYYRGGDTTTTSIIDSYNQTFTTIHNTTNNTTTNNYKANVKLENFLNQYTTNNNNYTYSADFKSWYYDNTTNNYNYTTNNLYYNQDNSKYYLTIDNSTDEYYLIDVQYSPTFVTVNYTYNTTAVKVGYIKSNPASTATLPRIEKKEIHPLTDEQVKAFLSAASSDEYHYLPKTILFTGMRESEAIGLTWDCVDFKAGIVKVCKQLQKRPLADGGFTFASLKNDKVRTLKPAPFVMDLLKGRKREQMLQKLSAGENWQGWQSAEEQETALVFTGALGTNLHPQTVYNHYRKIAAQIGAPDTCVHGLRHTFAVLSLQNGDDFKTVQGNLGHATASFTLDVYGHVSEHMKEESAQRMQAYISGL